VGGYSRFLRLFVQSPPGSLHVCDSERLAK
jgi:hypothetical protein